MDCNRIGDYIVDFFNRVEVLEFIFLFMSLFSDVSLKEMHTIEIIGKNTNVTPSDIARELMLTLGTVTTSLNKLEAKGYIERKRSKLDRRVVHLTLTKKGKLLDRLHRKFHKNMVIHIAEDMNEQEFEALAQVLKNLHKFLEELM